MIQAWKFYKAIQNEIERRLKTKTLEIFACCEVPENANILN